ncbi:unnamed protein product [Closterium sp. Yama58-4]|nr:unnamed protein product [Closterium sp. Yama58-4]
MSPSEAVGRLGFSMRRARRRAEDTTSPCSRERTLLLLLLCCPRSADPDRMASPKPLAAAPLHPLQPIRSFLSPLLQYWLPTDQCCIVSITKIAKLVPVLLQPEPLPFHLQGQRLHCTQEETLYPTNKSLRKPHGSQHLEQEVPGD